MPLRPDTRLAPRPAVPFALAAAGLLLAACATGGAPSFADSGPAAAPPPAAAVPSGPILAASGNAVLPIYNLGGQLVTPSLPALNGTGLQAQLTPGGATVGAQAGPLSTSLALQAPTSPLLSVDLGGGALLSPTPAPAGSGGGLLGPGGTLLGPNGVLGSRGPLGGLLTPPPVRRP